MNPILKFVTSYIRQHMSHETRDVRNEILKAINVGMAETFPEDNLSSRISSTVKFLAENDPEISAMYAECPGGLEVVGSAAKSGIIEANIIK